LSRRLVDTFVQSAYFDVVEHVNSMAEMRKLIDRGKVKTGLIIPPKFSRDVLSSRGTDLQLIIDGTDSNPANAALATSQSIIASFVQKEGLVPVAVSPIDFRPRLWYNPDLKSTYFMIPGLIGFLIQLIVPMITATAIVREKEQGNIEQLLVTPIKPFELMVGKLIPYVCVGLIMATLIITASRFLFHVPIRGSLLILYALTLLYIFVCLGIGLLASTVADNQQQATQIVMIFVAPSILLSGFLFPRETMPMPVFYLGYLVPLTYFVQITRGIILKGLGVIDLWEQIVPLMIMAIVIVGLSVKRFAKRIK
jgi:ABC-2 type transport system permease protein